MKFCAIPVIHVQFAEQDCGTRPVRALCTAAAARRLTLRPRAEQEAIQTARARQQSDGFATAYAQRAGVEGTMAQAVRVCGLRQARYRGLCI